MRAISYISSGGLETGAYKWQMTPSLAISITTKVSSSREMAATPCSSKLTSVIRVWGTTAGLGEIALKGPTKDTVLDFAGTVDVPHSKVLSVIYCSY